MRHELNIRFGQPLRTLRLADPDALAAAERQAANDPHVRAMNELAAAKHLEQQERQAVQQALNGLVRAAEQLTTARTRWLDEMQQAAVELAAAIATRVTYDKLQSDTFAIEELVQAVVGQIETPGSVQVRLHPDDLALLHRRLGEEQLAAWNGIELIPDDTLRRGDCEAEAGDVSFASRLEEQLAGIRQHLLRNLSDAQSERRKAATGDRELRRFPGSRQTA